MNGLHSTAAIIIPYLTKTFFLSLIWMAAWLPLIFIMRKRSADKKYMVFLTVLLFIPFLPVMTADSFIHYQPGVASVMRDYNPVSIDKILSRGGVSENFINDNSMTRNDQTIPGNNSQSEDAGFLTQMRYVDVLLFVWFAGFIFFSIKYPAGFYSLKRILKRSNAYDPAKLKRIIRSLPETGILRRTRFRISGEISSPISFGIIKPVVIVPSFTYYDLNDSGIEQIILHELAHLKRNDSAVVIILRIMEAVFFFNPLIWYLSGKLQFLQEECCDDIVFQYSSDRPGYAENLLAILSRTAGIKYSAVNGISGGGKNLERIKKILNPGEQMKNTGLKKIIFILTAGIAAGCIFVTCSNTSVQNTGKGVDSSIFPREVAAIIDEMNDYQIKNTMVPLMESDLSRMNFLNRALDKASEIKDGKEKKRTIMNLLLLKTDFLYDFEEIKKICTEQLPVARELGDRAAEGRCLFKLSEYGRIFNKKQKAVNEKMFYDALRIFRETGRNDLLQWALISDIANSLEENSYDKVFSVAGELVDIMKKTGKEDDAVIASAIDGFINDLKKNYSGNILMLYHCTAEIFTRGDDGRVVYSGEPGFGGSLGMSDNEMALFDYPFYWMLANSGGIAYEWLKKGESETVKSFSFSREYLQSTITCVSDDEKVEVPAGTFSNCRHIRIITTDIPAPGDKEKNESENSKNINRIIKGQLNIWYAPGTGIVRVTRKQYGTESSLVLTGCRITGNDSSYFPLSKGSSWEYTVSAGKAGKYISRYVSRVESEIDGKYYLSSYGYAFRRK